MVTTSLFVGGTWQQDSNIGDTVSLETADFHLEGLLLARAQAHQSEADQPPLWYADMMRVTTLTGEALDDQLVQAAKERRLIAFVGFKDATTDLEVSLDILPALP